MKTSNQKGFTLVELSIVLVIIGLLIGGILAAQSMITTTKIQSFVRQIGQFDAAIATFEDKFGGIPGDAVSLSGGDGDGIIEGASNGMTGERGRFWSDLGSNGLKNEDGATYAANGTTIGTNVPVAKIGNGIGVWPGYNTGATTGVEKGNYYRVGGGIAAALTAVKGLKAADGLAIDIKMDNGTATSGNVINQFNLTTADGDYNASGALPATYADDTSIFAIRMGSVTGALK
jgi:prepilin-type N-terminal cleavage/methylation domain-containing protein